jgi:hypothetical protein
MNGPSHIAIVGSAEMAAALMRNPRLNIECIFIVGGEPEYEKSAAELHDELYALPLVNTTVECEEEPIKKPNHANFTYDWRKSKRR